MEFSILTMVFTMFFCGIIFIIIAEKQEKNRKAKMYKDEDLMINRANKILTEIMENLSEDGFYNISVYDHDVLVKLNELLKLYYKDDAILVITVIDNKNKVLNIDDKCKTGLKPSMSYIIENLDKNLEKFQSLKKFNDENLKNK